MLGLFYMKDLNLTATEFKAKCLGILDEVDSSGTVVTITKRGRPVATLQSVKAADWRSPEGVLKGKIDLDALGDIVNPPVGIRWNALECLPNPAVRGKNA